MGGTTPVCNAKNIGVSIGLSFHRIPHWLGLWKVDVCNLVSDGTNFVPPFWNIDQLLQIGVKYVFDSYCILITIFILKKNISLASTIFFFLKTYVITHTAKTHLSCSILQCFNQVYKTNERKMLLWANTKLRRTQISIDSFLCIYSILLIHI